MQKVTKAVGSLVRPALGFVAIALLMLCAGGSTASRADEKEVAALDTLYQKAVKNNDVATMDRILSEDFVLVTGKGRTQTKADRLKESSSGNIVYEHQDTNQAVRAWGNTAVVTAFLRAKGTDKGKAFDYKLWFSDVYVRTPAGWRYVFGQACRLKQRRKESRCCIVGGIVSNAMGEAMKRTGRMMRADHENDGEFHGGRLFAARTYRSGNPESTSVIRTARASV